MRALIVALFTPLVSATSLLAYSAPHDLWTEEVLRKIRDTSTLHPQIIPRQGYFEVFFDSEVGDAMWADSEPPYEVHRNGTVRIHGYLASPLVGGPYPGVVVGHGHGGRGEPEVAKALAALGYVALAIDGPRPGPSGDAPRDTEQGWISVEEAMNEPSPEVSYLYHYAYAGMRALTFLEWLSKRPFNLFRVDRAKLGVVGASMGGQFTYYINGVDDRVKGAVAIAVAGDWPNLLNYEGAWLYHGLYYYTRDGIRSGQDALNTVSNVCDDPTARTFFTHFDPIQYAPKQHGPLLTIIGTHDQYFSVPAINTTFDQVQSAGTHAAFAKRVLMVPNAKHEVVNGENVLSILSLVKTAHDWLRYAFRGGAAPPVTPSIQMDVVGNSMVFRVQVSPGSRALSHVLLHFASQIDTFPDRPCDFETIRLSRRGGEYVGALPLGVLPACGPPVSPETILYFATAYDVQAFRVSSKLYYGSSELAFGGDFAPAIEHFPRDAFPVPPVPERCSVVAPQ